MVRDRGCAFQTLFGLSSREIADAIYRMIESGENRFWKRNQGFCSGQTVSILRVSRDAWWAADSRVWGWRRSGSESGVWRSLVSRAMGIRGLNVRREGGGQDSPRLPSPVCILFRRTDLCHIWPLAVECGRERSSVWYVAGLPVPEE